MATINLVRDKLVNFEVFKEGDRWLGMADVTLPDIGYKTATLSGAGIGGEIDMPTPSQTESMQLEINWRTINGDVTELLQPRAHDLELRGANEHYDAGTGELKYESVKINVRGLPVSGGLGTLKPADHTESKNTLELLYLKITIDGEKKVEIDKLNYIHFVNGTDFAEPIRNALGL